ncbi:MAG: TIGR01777 family oxidoreductase [Rhizobacter sp.]
MSLTLFLVLAVQAILGAFDNLWHHELEAHLPRRLGARRELALHAAREGIYAVVFIAVAWFECRGAWALGLGLLLATELVITLADFLEEDRTRRLPPLERLLHTVLTAMFGAFICLMVPVLADWASLPTALVVTPRGTASWIFTAFAAGVFLWAVRNVLALHSTRGPAAAALAQTRMRAATGPVPTPAEAPVTVLVTGGTGFVGRALVANLVQDGRRVIVLSRDLMSARGLLHSDVTVIDRLDTIPAETRIDAIVHLAGARVLGMPWTRARRRTLVDSRVALTRELVGLMRRLQRRPTTLVAASAIGWYGVPQNRASMRGEGTMPLDETAPAQPGQFVSDLCIAVEHEAQRAEGLGVRVVRLRLGVVLGHGDGAWPMQAFAARLGLAAILGTGRQPAPWLHLDDAVGLIRLCLQKSTLFGAVNAVAPDTPTQRAFATTLAAAYGRRAWLRVPAAPLRWLGGEMSSLMLEGQAVAPKAVIAAGYQFRYSRLNEACLSLARA